ncbi:MAG: DUF2124 family protein [Methanobacteriaceae archaeon]|nr:DUF2124 family protein [Methanobacteriaceae archaeon]
MEKIKEFEGIKGHLEAFKDEVKDAERIAFAGVPGVCTPFALLFAYAIREKETIFIPMTEVDKARKMEITNYGLELGEKTNSDVDVLVLLGGLSIPHIGSEPSQINELIENVLGDGGTVIGISYMDMFRKVDWDSKVDFDCIINADLKGCVLK